MVHRDNAGRLGCWLIYACLETRWLGQNPWFLSPGATLYSLKTQNGTLVQLKTQNGTWLRLEFEPNRKHIEGILCQGFVRGGGGSFERSQETKDLHKQTISTVAHWWPKRRGRIIFVIMFRYCEVCQRGCVPRGVKNRDGPT